MGGVTIEWADVISVVNLVRTHIIVLAVALVAMIAAIVFAVI